jgi:hypothetical protein
LAAAIVTKKIMAQDLHTKRARPSRALWGGHIWGHTSEATTLIYSRLITVYRRTNFSKKRCIAYSVGSINKPDNGAGSCSPVQYMSSPDSRSNQTNQPLPKCRNDQTKIGSSPGNPMQTSRSFLGTTQEHENMEPAEHKCKTKLHSRTTIGLYFSHEGPSQTTTSGSSVSRMVAWPWFLILPGGKKNVWMNKLNPGPRVSHLGRTAIKTLAIHTTDQIQFSYNTPNNNHPAPIISRHQLNLTVGGPRHRKITALRQNSGTNNQPIHTTPTRSYAR